MNFGFPEGAGSNELRDEQLARQRTPGFFRVLAELFPVGRVALKWIALAFGSPCGGFEGMAKIPPSELARRGL